MDSELTKRDWIFWSLFAVLITVIGVTLFWFIDPATWNYYTELAFIIFLIGVAGWVRALRRFVLIGLVCVLVYLLMAAFESPEYKAGAEAFDDEDFETAVAKLKTVIDGDPEHYEAAYRLCVAHSKLERYEEALPYCNRAIKLDYPIKNESYSARARVLRGLNRPKAAIDDFTESLRYFKSWYVLWERCRLYNQVKRYDDAIRDCRKALAMNKTFYDVWWPLGNAYYQKRDFKKALEAYTRYHQNAAETPEFMKQRIKDLRDAR